jgi:outer membrane lipoprotein-sorting protein
MESMRTTRFAALCSVFCLLAFASSASAQTADEIVEKYLAAVGGRDALSKLTTRRSTGVVTISVQGADLSGPIEISTKAPNKGRAYMKLDLTALGAGEMIIDQRFDGTSGVAMNSLQGDSEITGNQLENMRNNVFPTPLLAYKTAGTTLEALPRGRVGATEALVLQMTPKTGSVTRLYFDAATGLLLKTVATVSAPELGSFEQTSEVSDYRSVDGVLVPFMTVTSSPMQTITVALSKVEHNVTLDDALFGRK